MLVTVNCRHSILFIKNTTKGRLNLPFSLSPSKNGSKNVQPSQPTFETSSGSEFRFFRYLKENHNVFKSRLIGIRIVSPFCKYPSFLLISHFHKALNI